MIGKQIWSVDSGVNVQTLKGHSDAVTCISQESKRIISGSLDRTLKIWDPKSGVCVSTLDWMSSEGHTGLSSPWSLETEVDFLTEPKLREPWSSGGSCFRGPSAIYWMDIFTLICCKNCIICLKKDRKWTNKRLGLAHFFKKCAFWYDCDPPFRRNTMLASRLLENPLRLWRQDNQGLVSGVSSTVGHIEVNEILFKNKFHFQFSVTQFRWQIIVLNKINQIETWRKRRCFAWVRKRVCHHQGLNSQPMAWCSIWMFRA